MAGERTGIVDLADFHIGVATTLGAVIPEDPQFPRTANGHPMVIKNIPGVSPPPDYEGVPVFFAFPDDVHEFKILPSFVIRCDSVLPAMSRWHLGVFEYRIPAPGANPVTIRHPITDEIIAEGFDKYESKDQAVPYDFLYTIQCRARYRNNMDVEGMKMQSYTIRKYQPYTTVRLVDSLGDTRSYDAFMESPSIADLKPDTAGRENNHNITLRIEGELDGEGPFIQQPLTSLINTRLDLLRK